MTNVEEKAAKIARVLAIVHIVVAFLLICIGIADILVPYHWFGVIGFGIWSGCLARISLGFSIACAMAGGVIIIFYSFVIGAHKDDYKNFNDYRPYRYQDYYYSEMALSKVTLALGVLEFVIGIWTAVCLCLMKPCACCYGTPVQQEQVIYTTNGGYVKTQGPSGIPMAMPLQDGAGMATIQTFTPESQQDQPPVVIISVTGEEGYPIQLEHVYPARAMDTGYQPQKVQVAEAEPAGSVATGYQPQRVHKPPSYADSQYDEML